MSRRYRSSAGLILLAVAAYALAASCAGGCTQYVRPDGTPVSPAEGHLIAATDVYTAFVDEVDAALVGGYLQPAALAPWLPVRNAARVALAKGRDHAAKGDLGSVQADVDEANAALSKLAPLRDYLKQQKAAKPADPGKAVPK